MEVLFNSPDLTATIVVSLRYRRDSFVRLMNETINKQHRTLDNKSVIEGCNKIIEDCNIALLAIGIS